MADALPNLNEAYSISSLVNNRKLYAEWAKDYDLHFIVAVDYILPNQVAEQFLEYAG